MDSTILNENITTTSEFLSMNINNPFDEESSIEESKVETDSDNSDMTLTDVSSWDINDVTDLWPNTTSTGTNTTSSSFPPMLHVSNLTSTIPPPPPPLPMQVTINTHAQSPHPPSYPPSYPPPPLGPPSLTSLPNISISQPSLISPIISQSDLSSLSNNILNILTNNNNNSSSLDGFSPEDIEELQDSDSDDDMQETKTSTNPFINRLANLPDNHFSISIVWDFELNYDYYKINSAHYFPICKSLNYKRVKTQIENYNRNKNMKLGKVWEFPKSDKFINGFFVYFIIYFNIMEGHIDIEFYGIFDEEINEANAIKQIIDMGIYGTTGKMHKNNITCTDGVGFNFYKYHQGW